MSEPTHFHGLFPAEAERLAVLLEELGEAQQAIGKILRHGYESHHPNGGPTNREALEREMGDVLFALDMLTTATDLDRDGVEMARGRKREAIKPYLHHAMP
jgi:NTP pyrophosphatase (non-canonical NTP hydrolase)